MYDLPDSGSVWLWEVTEARGNSPWSSKVENPPGKSWGHEAQGQRDLPSRRNTLHPVDHLRTFSGRMFRSMTGTSVGSNAIQCRERAGEGQCGSWNAAYVKRT